MELKYRLKKVEFPTCKTLYFAQYRFLFCWMHIGINQEGYWLSNPSTYCESIEEAQKRVEQHRLNMKRASDWPFRGSTYYSNI